MGDLGVVGGLEDEVRKLKSYNLQTGAEVQSLDIDDAWGLAEVTLCNRPFLATVTQVS